MRFAVLSRFAAFAAGFSRPFAAVTLLFSLSIALPTCAQNPPDQPVSPTPETKTTELRMGVVLPGTCEDWSWNQGLCEAVRDFPPMADGTTLVSELAEGLYDMVLAEDQARKFLAEGMPIIMLHGTQYLPLVRELAPEFPNTMFVFGSNEKTPFANVVAYDVQPQEGSYLMGMAAGLMTRTNIISIIAPMDVNESVGHARGFEEGVLATNPQAIVNVTYTGTFDNPRLAASLARRSLVAGADILTGSSQQSLSALLETRDTPDALWAATSYDVSSFAPQTVMASLVYDFRALLTQVLTQRSKGYRGNFVVTMSLSNGSMQMRWSDLVPPSIRAIVDNKQQQIMAGTFKPEIKTLRYHSIAGY